MTRPAESEYAPDYQGYVARVSEDDILPVLRSQLDELDALLSTVKPDGETYAYADGKWSIREIVKNLLLGHVGRKILKHFINRYAQSSNARFTAAFIWIDRDVVAIVHGQRLRLLVCPVKSRFGL